MPVINRVRLVNIMYDHKYISDKIINFYNGSNALMNLANGHGKSVIVQMLFQPIIPMMQLAGRKVSSYLSDNSTPSYVLVEWILDNTKNPIYFLTGIAMSKIGSSSEDEERGNVKYFTFTHRYEKGNDFDIRNIPILKRENNHTAIFSYAASSDKLKSYAAKKSDFNFYSQNNKRLYLDELTKHQISIKEWELLAKVNQKESGIDELFMQCKSSDSLFERWILKTISDSNADSRLYLIDCVKELMKKIVDKEENIKEKEFCESLADSLDEFCNNLILFCDTLDQKENKEKEFSGVYKYKNRIKNELYLKREESRRIQDECRAEFERIEIERCSKECYSLEDSRISKDNEVNEIKAAVPEYESGRDKAQKEFESMKAAQFYNAKCEAENKLNAIWDALKVLENDEQEIKLYNLGYSIREFYIKEKSRIDGELYKNSQGLTQIKNQIYENKTKKDNADNLRTELISKCTELKVKLDSFTEYEAETETKIGILPSRDMTGVFMNNSSEEIAEKLSGNYTRALEQSKEISARQSLISAEIDKEKDKEKNLNDEIKVHNNQLANARSSLDKCKNSMETTEKILAKYEIGSKYIFDKENNLSRLREKQGKLQTQIDENRFRKERLSETLEAFNAGRLYTSKQFAKLLENNGIDFQTGEEYLSAQNNAEYQAELLENNPILPYCFIVSDKDFSRAIELEGFITTDRVCPVISKSKIGETEVNENGEVIIGNLRLFSLYDYESISADSRSSYAEKLELEISELNDILSEDNRAINEIVADISAVEGFKYTEEELTALNAAVEDERMKIESLEIKLAECRKAKDNLSAEKDAFTKKAFENERFTEECKNKIDLYSEYIEKAEEDLKRRGEYSKSKSRLDETESEINKLEKELEELNLSGENIKELQKKLEIKLSVVSNEIPNYSKYNNGTLIEKPIEEMKTEFSILFDRSNTKRNEYDYECKECQKEIDRNTERLKRDYSNLSESDYNLEYSYSEEKRLERIYSAKSGELLSIKNDLDIAEKSLKQITSDLKEAYKKLKSRGLDLPLPKSEILDKFEERKAECGKRQEAAGNDEKKFGNEIRVIENQIDQIKRINGFTLPDNSCLINIKEIDYDININKEEELYDNLNFEVKKGKKNLEKLFAEMKDKYSEKNNTLAEGIFSYIQLDKREEYSDFYYNVFEPVSIRLEDLRNHIKILKADLTGIENDKENMIHQIFEHAKILYNEVKSISDNSKVAIQKEGGKRKVLDIDVQEKLDNQAQDRIKIFVDNAIVKMRELLRDSVYSDSELIKSINNIFSDRQLFNAVTGKETVKVRVYKVQSDYRNSKLMPWESVYSGGEKFITCFILFSALMSYTRNTQSLGNGKNLRTVCLMDNPFAKTSSKHLLDAMLEISKRFKTQLICLTALSESSITNNFDLIYQLSLKSAMYSSTSYLEIDNVINNSDEKIDSKLDYISMYNNSQYSFL